jgi:PAS domain S-box-containing protein
MAKMLDEEFSIQDCNVSAAYAGWILESLYEAVCTKDKEGRYVYLNPAMRRWLGVKTIDEAIGKTDFEFFPEDVAAARRKDEKYLIESQRGSISKEEMLIEPATGVLKWYQVTKSLLRNEKKEIIGVVEVYRDITSKKESAETVLQIQAELVRKEAAMSSLINNTDDYIWAVDREYNVSVANESVKKFVRKVLGKEVEIGMTFSLMVPPEDVEVWNKYINDALSGERVVFETKFTLPNGRPCYEEVTINPIKDFQGEIFGAAIFVRDVTRRKMIEEELQHLNQELEKKLIEIQRTQAQLVQSEKMNSLGQMVSGIAHELNTPIGYVQNNIDLIKRRFEKVTALYALSLEAIACMNQNEIEDALRKFQEISESEISTSNSLHEIAKRTQKLFDGCTIGLEQMSKLVKSMRNFSRLDEAEMKAANLVEGLNSILLILNHTLREKRIRVETNFQELPIIDCYPAQLNQAFMNILQNAIYAVEEVKEPKIFISAKSKDGFIIVDIQDNGIGIPKEIHTKIFDPFFTTKPVGKGVGLGLSIAYSIIEKHGGTISFQTEVGKGTIFTIKIPAQEFVPTK